MHSLTAESAMPHRDRRPTKHWCAKAGRPSERLARYWATTLAALAVLLPLPAPAQAPVRERSETATPLEGARRAADVARNELAAAQRARDNADLRLKKAEEALAAAQKELAAARADATAAAAAVSQARTADEQARAALAKALDGRK